MVMATQCACLLSHTGCPLRFLPSFFSDGSAFCSTIPHVSSFLVCSHSVLAVFPTSILRNDKWKFSETSFVWKQKFYLHRSVNSLSQRRILGQKVFFFRILLSSSSLSFSLSVALRSPKSFWLLILCICLIHIRDSLFVESSIHPTITKFHDDVHWNVSFSFTALGKDLFQTPFK